MIFSQDIYPRHLNTVKCSFIVAFPQALFITIGRTSCVDHCLSSHSVSTATVHPASTTCGSQVSGFTAFPCLHCVYIESRFKTYTRVTHCWFSGSSAEYTGGKGLTEILTGISPHWAAIRQMYLPTNPFPWLNIKRTMYPQQLLDPENAWNSLILQASTNCRPLDSCNKYSLKNRTIASSKS